MKLAFSIGFLLKNYLLRAYSLGSDWSGRIVLIKSEILIKTRMVWPVSSDNWKRPLVYCHRCSIWFQTSTSVKEKPTTAVLMRFVTTPKDTTTAHVNQDMKETEIIAKVSYFCNLVSFYMPSKALLFLLFLSFPWQYVFYRNRLLDTIEPLHNGHLGDRRKWPLWRADF